MSDQDRMERLRRAARERLARQDGSERGSLDPDEVRAERRLMRADDIAIVAREALAAAERRGDFADNPYRGKPLPGNDGRHDPDWWVKRLIERERISGLGPPALALRREDAELDDRLDAEHDEDRVREIVEDFDARVIEARRQLLGGPPVVTRVRDVDEEVRRWRERRRIAEAAAAAASAAADLEAARAEEERRAASWWSRLRRGGRGSDGVGKSDQR